MKTRLVAVRARLVAAGVVCLGVAAAPLFAEKPDIRARLVVPETAPAGSRVNVAVEMTVGNGWHVNSHTPADKFLVPTDVTLSTTAGTLSPVQYPPHVERRFAFSDEPLLVYEGTVRFEAVMEIPAGARDTAALHGVVSYQACNDRQCFPPTKIPLEASISLTAGR